MTDEDIELEIQAKGLNAPRVSMPMIEAFVVDELYDLLSDGKTTVCSLVMRNGYTVQGMSAPVSLSNFDDELGRKIARQDALSQCWSLFGFALACQVSGEGVG